MLNGAISGCGRPDPLIAAFSLDRFTTAALVEEHGAAAVAN